MSVENIMARFSTKDGFLNALEEREYRTLYLLDAPKSITYNSDKDVFIMEAKVSEERDGEYWFETFPEVLPYALKGLFSYFKCQDLTEFVKLLTKVDIMNTYGNTKHTEAFKCMDKYLKDENATRMNLRRIEGILSDIWFQIRTNNPLTEDIKLHWISDCVGSNVRSFTAERYTNIRDLEIYKGTDTIINSESDWKFRRGTIGTVLTTAEYLGDETKTIRDEEFTVGGRVSHSEHKYKTYSFQNLVWRQICSNGMWGITRGFEHKVKHSNLYSKPKDNQLKIFTKSMTTAILNGIKKTDTFIDRLTVLNDVKNELIPAWSELYETMKFSNFPVKVQGKEKVDEIAMIGRARGYNRTAEGLFNALTYWGTHQAKSQSDRDLANKKANRIIVDAKNIELWTPPEGEIENNKEKQKRVGEWIEE